MQISYIADGGAQIVSSNASPPMPDVLLCEADGIYGYENTTYVSDQSGQDGSVYVGSKLSARRVGLTIRLMRDVVATRNLILRTIAPKSLGTLRLVRGALTRDIRCVVEKVSVNTQDGAIMNLFFLCPNPYWREESESRVHIATWQPMLHYPLSIEQGVGFMFGQRTEERVINVRNAGTATAGMRVVFTARNEVINPKISYAMDGSQYIQINTTLHEGDILTIQTGVGDKKATLYRAEGGQTQNAFSLIDIANVTFLQLLPGDNFLSYSATSGENFLMVTVFYYSSYLEV